jgi:hypothetical protein
MEFVRSDGRYYPKKRRAVWTTFVCVCVCLKRRREKTTAENLSLLTFYVPPSICVELGTKI